jgi:hypothetical protein
MGPGQRHQLCRASCPPRNHLVPYVGLTRDGRRQCPLVADSVEKVENPGLPKSQPIRDLSKCWRSMLFHFRYAAPRCLNAKLAGPPAQFSVSASTPVKKSEFAENELFQHCRRKAAAGSQRGICHTMPHISFECRYRWPIVGFAGWTHQGGGVHVSESRRYP